MTRALTLAATLVTITLSIPAAHADSVTITLDQPLQITHAGDTTVNFKATITADPGNSGDIYFNTDSYNVDSPFTVDDIGLFLNFPYPISAGQSFDGVLFTINMPGSQSDGTYLGSFSILGGSDGGSLDSLGSVNFEIDQVPAVTSVPEPGTLLLCSTGLATLLGAATRRSQEHTLRR